MLSPIARYFDFQQQYECDQAISETTLRRRDREFALENANLKDRSLLHKWHDKRQQDNPRPVSQLWQQHHRLYVFFTWVIALFAGIGICRAALYYDGRHPINLITVLSILVFFQIFILSILALISLPFATRLRQAFMIFNPVFWLTRLIDRFSLREHSEIQSLSNLQAFAKIDKRVMLDYLLALAQHFAVAFNLGILACLLFLVFSSDLAFGWNTTLQIDNHYIYQITQWLALPWQHLFSDAVPSEQLINISRYYRLDDALSNRSIMIEDYAQQLGQWWKFIAMCVLTYGLFPRIILWFVFARRLKNSVRETIFSHAYSSTLIDRMRTPLIDTLSQQDESQHNKEEVKHRALRTELNLNMTCPVLIWSDAQISARQLKRFGIVASHTSEIGGNFTPKQDKQAITEITKTEPAGLVFICKGFEAPTYDLMDTIELARKLLKDKKKPILVLLSSNANIALNKDQIDGWETIFNEHGDQNLYVEAVNSEFE